MKAKDIKPGVVYGYRSSKNGSITPIVFLAPVDSEHIYGTTSSYRESYSPAFVKARAGMKPSHGDRWSPTYGYPAITNYSDDDSATDALTAATLSGFESTTSSLASTEPRLDYRLVTSLGHVVGPYEEAKAAAEAQQKADRERREAEFAARRSAEMRADHLVEKLAAFGVTAKPDESLSPTGLVISFDQLDKFLAMLTDSEED